jgi:hypothetical protein
MRLDDVDEVARLAHERQQALGMIEAARQGTLNWQDAHFLLGGAEFGLAVYAAEPLIRHAAEQACAQKIEQIEARLIELNVGFDPQPQVKRDLADWKLLAEMYERAWIDAVGTPLPDRPHLVDALSERTRELRKLAEGAVEVAALVPPPITESPAPLKIVRHD